MDIPYRADLVIGVHLTSLPPSHTHTHTETRRGQHEFSVDCNWSTQPHKGSWSGVNSCTLSQLLYWLYSRQRQTLHNYLCRQCKQLYTAEVLHILDAHPLTFDWMYSFPPSCFSTILLFCFLSASCTSSTSSLLSFLSGEYSGCCSSRGSAGDISSVFQSHQVYCCHSWIWWQRPRHTG